MKQNRRLMFNFLFKIIVLGVSLFLCNNVSAQNLKGTVKSIDGQALVSASVILYEKDSTSLLSFAMTDEDGFWGITDTDIQKEMILITSYLGYKDSIVKIDDAILERKSVDITLKSDALLDEIVVKGRQLNIIVSGDTLTYNANAFKHVGDQNLGDILDNMPNVDVKSNGDIFFNGKKVDQLLVESKDILSSQHKLTTEGFQADDIQAVRFIKNYRPFDQQYFPFHSDQVAMDILLTDDAVKNVNGDVELMAGFKNAYQVSSNMYKVGEKTGFTAFARSNNIGKEVMSQGDFLSLQGNFMEVLNQTKGDFSQIIPDGFQHNKSMQKSYGNVLLLNWEKNKNNNHRFRVATMSNFSKRSSTSNIDRNYTTGNEYRLTGVRTKNTEFPYFFARMDLREYFPEKKTNYSIEIPFYTDLTSNSQFYNGDIAALNFENDFQNKLRKTSIAPKFHFYKKKWENIGLLTKVNSAIVKNDTRIKLTQNQSLSDFFQNQNNLSGTLNALAGLIFTKKDWNIRGDVVFKTFSLNKSIESTVDEYNNTIKHESLQPEANLVVHYDKAHWLFEFKGNQSHNYHTINGNKFENILNNFTQILRYSFNTNHYILLQGDYQELENPYNLSYQTYEYVNENITRYNSLKSGTVSKGYSSLLAWSWFDRERNISLKNQFLYNRNYNRPFQDVILKDGILFQSYTLSKSSDYYSVNGDLSYKWIINKGSNVDFDLGYSYDNSEYKINNQSINQNSFQYNLGFEYVVFSGLEFGYSFRKERRRQATLSQNWISYLSNHNFKGIWSLQNFRSEISAEYNKQRYKDISNNFSIVNAKLEYQMSNNWTIKAEGRDILNLSPKRIYSNTIEAAYFEIQDYQRFRGSVTIGLKKLF